MSLPEDYGKGFVRSLSPRQGMLLIIEEYRLNKNFVLTMDSMQYPLGFSFCLSGRVQWDIIGSENNYVTETGDCELLFTKRTNWLAEYASTVPVSIINILLCPKLFRSFWDKSFDEGTDGACRAIFQTEEDVLYRKNRIPSTIQCVLKQLMRASCNCMADALFTQSKILELVAFQLELFSSSPAHRKSGQQNTQYLQAINSARSILKSNMQAPPSLPNLSRMVGINETKLKRGFRDLYGTTAYTYLLSCRMERACRMLSKSDISFSDIAFELGYSERTHFSRAFTRYYGYPPSVYQQKHC